MIVFGGFHEALRTETRWFNDIHIFDFQSSAWTELQYGKLARLPPARSACNMVVCTAPSEALFVYGGYSKLKNVNAPGGSKSEGIMHVDCWVLPLKSLVGGVSAGGANPPSWERISRKGEYPSPRAGTSSILHKNKMLLFGGVLDNEGDHHKMESVFYDDLFALDLERRRWFSMKLKKASGSGGRRRKKKDKGDNEQDTADGGSDDGDGSEDELSTNDAEVISSGWDLDKLRHGMFAFIDGDGNIVYEKIEDEDATEEESKEKRSQDSTTIATEVERELESIAGKTDVAAYNEVSGESQQQKSLASSNASSPAKPSQKIAASAVMKVNEKGVPVFVARQTPLPRINCATVVKGNTLYIYGGVLEVGDREVTLDDCWSIDLNKRDKWTCIWSGQMHKQVWKGVDSDNDSYISSDQGGDESDEDEFAEFEAIAEGDEGELDEEARKAAKKEAKRAAKKAAKAGIREEISSLKEQLGLDNDQRTPLMGENKADFYSRTTEYWNMEAVKTVGQAAADRGEALSSKELKREGFQLANDRFDELKPILDRLNELETMQQEAEEHKKEKKKTKPEKKPKKDRR